MPPEASVRFPCTQGSVSLVEGPERALYPFFPCRQGLIGEVQEPEKPEETSFPIHRNWFPEYPKHGKGSRSFPVRRSQSMTPLSGGRTSFPFPPLGGQSWPRLVGLEVLGTSSPLRGSQSLHPFSFEPPFLQCLPPLLSTWATNSGRLCRALALP